MPPSHAAMQAQHDPHQGEVTHRKSASIKSSLTTVVRARPLLLRACARPVPPISPDGTAALILVLCAALRFVMRTDWWLAGARSGDDFNKLPLALEPSCRLLL